MPTDSDLRSACHGLPPLPARLEPWMGETLSDPAAVSDLVRDDAPTNLHEVGPFGRNVRELQSAAGDCGVRLNVFMARKADKCLAYVAEANRLGVGVDVAGTNELRQTLEAGTPPDRVICTAAVKSRSLIAECVRSGVTAAIDNLDELDRFAAEAESQGRDAPVAVRAARFTHGGRTLPSRFGFDVGEVAAVAGRLAGTRLRLEGLHFHLDGYDGPQRVSAAAKCLDLVPRLRDAGHAVRFLDIGGGIPMSYVENESDWTAFWNALEADPAAVTVDGTRFRRGEGKSVYPYWQSPTRGEWLRRVLSADAGGGSLAGRVNGLGVELRCEPGRSLFDGCGVTLARVEYRKPDRVTGGGGLLVGLAMNRTQCRTTSEDFLVDPLLVPCGGERSEPADAALVGAYCMESEFLTKRRFRLPRGVAVGDVVAFPNTAGYMMHFLESRSHQFPLAPNLVRGDGWQADAVDAV